MKYGWKECKLGDVITSNPRSISRSYAHKTIKYLDTGSINGGRLDGYQEYLLEKAPSRAQRLVETNNIVYSLVRPIQRHYGFIIDPPDNLVVSTGFSVIGVNEKEADPRFIYYFLTSDDIVETLDIIAEASTSAYPSLRPADIEKLDISLPPLPEQRAIAAVLSSLDDKIDLLHRQNKTLESLAETIWRKMFVEEADPKWKEVSLLDIIDLVGGGTPKTDIAKYWDGTIPWLSAKDITSNHKKIIIETEKNITKLGVDKSSAKILPTNATIISARGTVGNYCMLAAPMAFSQSNYGVLPKMEGCYFFTYLLIASLVDELKSAAYGCVFDTITTNTFREQKIALPGENEIRSFEQNVSVYFNKILNNTIQICALSHLRDTLLQKLMSGEVMIDP